MQHINILMGWRLRLPWTGAIGFIFRFDFKYLLAYKLWNGGWVLVLVPAVDFVEPGGERPLNVGEDRLTYL